MTHLEARQCAHDYARLHQRRYIIIRHIQSGIYDVTPVGDPIPAGWYQAGQPIYPPGMFAIA